MALIIHERLRGRKAVAQRKRRLALYPLCKRCEAKGAVTATEEIDHIIPLHKGGEDTDENCQGLCKQHHVDKTNEDMGREALKETGLDGWPV